MYGECVKQQKGGHFKIDIDALFYEYGLDLSVNHFDTQLLGGLYADFASNFAGRVYISECVTAGVLVPVEMGFGLPGTSPARVRHGTRAQLSPPVQKDLHRKGKQSGNAGVREARRVPLINKPFTEEYLARPSFMSPPFGQPMPEKVSTALQDAEKILKFVRDSDNNLNEDDLWQQVDKEMGVAPGVARATYTLAKRLDAGELDLCRVIWDTQAAKWVDDLIDDCIFEMDD